MRSLRHVSLPLIGAALLSGCGAADHVNVNPMLPEGSPAKFELPATTSNLSLSVTSPLSSIKAILEEAVPKSFKFDDKHDVRAYGEPTRGELTITSDVPGKRIALSTSVSGKVQVEKQVIVQMSVGVETKGSISASLSPVVAKDWSVEPNLDLSAKLEKASTKIAGQNVDITGLVEGAVKGAIDGVKQKARDEVAKALNVKADIASIWNEINSVHQLSTSPSVWLRITPKKVTFAQIDYEPDSLKTGLALEVETHVFIQEDAPELMKAPLPELLLAATLPGKFELSIPVEVSYTTIDQRLKEELAKKPLALGGDVSLDITDATVEPYGDGILLTVKFKGKQGAVKSASGTLHISGMPVYDRVKVELRIDQLSYTAKTSSVLLNGVEWLAHSTLLEKIKSMAVVKLEAEMKKAKDEANQQLVGLKKSVPKEIVPDVSIVELTIDRVVFAKERAFAIVKANGKLSAQVQK